MWAWSELATRSVGRVASARAGVRSTAEYESYECVSKLEPIVRSCTRKYNTGTADDRRARVARAQYSMRHACSTRSLGHANVRKTCSVNSGHRFVPIPLPGIRQRHACAIRLLRAPWLRLTLRRSPSSSVLTLSRADVLVVLAGRRRRKRGFKARSEPRVGSREAPSERQNEKRVNPTPWPPLAPGVFLVPWPIRRRRQSSEVRRLRT